MDKSSRIFDAGHQRPAGSEVTIRESAELVRRAVANEGHLVFDASKPDVPPRKLLDGSRLQAVGWHAPTGLEDGIARTNEWFRARAREVPHAVAS